MSPGTPVKDGRRSSIRIDSDGVRQVRRGVWVREALANRFKQAADEQHVDMSDVLRSAILRFVRSAEQTAVPRNAKVREVALAKRVLRTLLTVLGAQEVMEEAMGLMTRGQVEAVMEKYRGEIG